MEPLRACTALISAQLIAMGCRGGATGFSGAAAQKAQQGVRCPPRDGENLVICDGRGGFPEPEEPTPESE